MSSEEDSYETYDGTSSSEVELPEPTPPPAAPTTPAPAGLVDEMSSTEEYHTFAADSNDSFDVTSSEYSEYDESSSVEDKVAIDMPSDSKIVQHVDGVNYEQSAYSKRLAQSKSEKLDFRWENISYWVKVKKEYKPILKNVSGECKAGTLMAIMGASGAGKTSLLNVLAGRADGTARGTIQINKKTFSGSEFRHLSAYVLQEDLLFGNLTVRETLMYAAKLRLPSSVSVKSKEELVQGLIEELGLVKCADNYVGSTMRRGISGGEKKRLSIACELIIDPSILFLDEPTSGLDAFTALNLIHTLQLLAKSGRTVICTIHQPRSGIYDLFDSLMLLAEGEVAYFGPAADAVHYFEKAGYKCPRYTNPADFFLDVTAINTHSEKNIKASKQHIRKLLDEFATSRRKLSSLESKPQKLDVKTRQGAGFFSQLIILSKRAAQNLYRDKPRTIFRIVQNIIVAVVLGLIFLRLDTDEIAVRDRSGLLFFIIINQGFGTMFQTLNVFLEEREIFAKERSAAWYSAGPYFLSKSLAELPMTFTPIILGCIVYFIANLNPSAEAFGFFLLVIYLTTFVTESLGLAIGALATSVAMANAMAPLLLIFLLMFGGFYINPDSIPVYFKWAEYVSFVRYGFEALVVNEFEGTTFTTVEGAPLPGSAIISSFGMDADWRWIDIGILVGMAFLFRLLAFLFLKFLRRGPRGKTLEPLSDADTHLSLESKETSDANNNDDTALKERKKK